MNEVELLNRIDTLAKAFTQLSTMMGARLTREQLAERLGVTRQTIWKRLKEDVHFPRPGRDGKFLLSEVVAWELDR